VISLIIGLSIAILISLIANVVMVWFAKTSLARIDSIYLAAENTSEIFRMIDTYKEHLKAVYEMPTFYGDETLQSLMDHTGQMIEFMKKYEEVYSFTQPDLEEQLLAANGDVSEHEEEEKQEEE